MLNASIAMIGLGITCRKDLFHEKLLVGGHPIQQWAGDLSDEVIQVVRKMIRHRFGFDPKKEAAGDAAMLLCLENQFDPVLDYLASLKWDGTPRLDRWLHRYMGAADTELNHVIGRVTLIAAVRRARDPGTKFDQIVVFESGEGKGKSTAIEILAGKENFSDQSILAKQDKEQQEAMCGIWLYEIADLTGMKKADIEHVKAFASRKVDRARPAYGRFRVDRPRRTVFFATTNDDEYLKSQTGNRRFWPVSTSKIDLEGLQQDRDQLWAEAAHLEAQGCSIALPERLWHVAGQEQERRLETDSWQDCIANYLKQSEKTDVTTHDVLVDNQFLRLEPSRIGRFEQMRAGNILRKLGFERYKKWVGTHTQNRYRKESGSAS
jgi:predicted P-loop ATPase